MASPAPSRDSIRVLVDALEVSVDTGDAASLELIIRTVGQLGDRLVDHPAGIVRRHAGKVRGLAEQATAFGRDLDRIAGAMAEELEDLGAALRIAAEQQDLPPDPRY